MNYSPEGESPNIKEKKKEAEETVRKIISFYENEKELTEKEKKEFLAIDEKSIPNDIYYMLYYVAKKYLESGKIAEFQIYKEKFIKERKISLKPHSEEMQKILEKEEESDENAREI